MGMATNFSPVALVPELDASKLVGGHSLMPLLFVFNCLSGRNVLGIVCNPSTVSQFGQFNVASEASWRVMQGRSLHWSVWPQLEHFMSAVQFVPIVCPHINYLNRVAILKCEINK